MDRIPSFKSHELWESSRHGIMGKRREGRKDLGPNSHRWESQWWGGLASLCHTVGPNASCKCSHLISQLTKYYGLAHKNQNAKLPGVLNSRSCDQKQAGSGDGSREAALAGQRLPLSPMALRQQLKPSRKLSPWLESQLYLHGESIKGIPGPPKQKHAASK